MERLNINKFFWLFSLALFVLLILAELVQRGMFLDGITYAAVSNNMANGLGDFFHPHYTQTWYSEFYMQLPLVFGLQSNFFKLFGSGFFVERFYAGTMAILSLSGILMNWNLFTKDFDFKELSWLPILFWVTTPIIFWAIPNNMIESTLCFFSSFAVYFISKGILSSKIIWFFIGSCFLLLSFLTKGLVGLFPLGVVVAYLISFRNITIIKTIAFSFLIIIICSGIFFTLIALIDGFYDNLILYLENQVIPSLNDEREITTDNRFGIIGRLIMEIAAPIIITLLIILINRKKKLKVNRKQLHTALFFIFIGMSASLPLIVTHQQRGYYLLPSLAFYILGFSIIIGPYISTTINNFSKKINNRLKIAAIGIVLASFIYCFINIGGFRRDEIKIADIEKISNVVEDGTIVSCSEELYQNWGIIAYLNRLAGISIDKHEHHEFFLTYKNDLVKDEVNNYQEVKINLKSFKLYKKTMR